jgi:hypothetical protein
MVAGLQVEKQRMVVESWALTRTENAQCKDGRLDLNLVLEAKGKDVVPFTPILVKEG